VRARDCRVRFRFLLERLFPFLSLFRNLSIRKRYSYRPKIPQLLIPGSPFTVSGLVITEVVDTLKSQPFRTSPHVSEKVHEAEPPIANLDSECPIVLVGGMLGIQTSRFHRCPYAVLTSTFSAVRLFRCLAVLRLRCRLSDSELVKSSRDRVVTDTQTLSD
jgi:hypothetical protein